jgi:hypothetical protein
MPFEFELYGDRYTFSLDDNGDPVVEGVDDSAAMWEPAAQSYCRALVLPFGYRSGPQWIEADYAKALGAEPPPIDTSHDPEDAIF